MSAVPRHPNEVKLLHGPNSNLPASSNGVILYGAEASWEFDAIFHTCARALYAGARVPRSRSYERRCTVTPTTLFCTSVRM